MELVEYEDFSMIQMEAIQNVVESCIQKTVVSLEKHGIQLQNLNCQKKNTNCTRINAEENTTHGNRTTGPQIKQTVLNLHMKETELNRMTTNCNNSKVMTKTKPVINHTR